MPDAAELARRMEATASRRPDNLALLGRERPIESIASETDRPEHIDTAIGLAFRA